MSLGNPTSISSNQNYDDNILSFFGRVNYNYNDRYLLTASLRADGSSKFGKNNKWGYFPAVSAAWRLAEEDFIKNLNIFSDLKLRLGYGLAGTTALVRTTRLLSFHQCLLLWATNSPTVMLQSRFLMPI